MTRKKKGVKKRLPAYSINPPDDAPLADVHAYELIKLFAGAMQALNNGVLPMPTHWREHLEDILEFHTVGRPPNPKVSEKHTETRRLMMLDEMARHRGEVVQQSRSSFLEDIAESRGYSDATQVYRDTKPYEGQAFTKILCDKLREKDEEERKERVRWAQHINERIQCGETLSEILSDPEISDAEFCAIRNHQEKGVPLEGRRDVRSSDLEKVIMWVNDGLSREISPPGYPRYIEMDDESSAFLKKKSERKKTIKKDH